MEHRAFDGADGVAHEGLPLPHSQVQAALILRQPLEISHCPRVAEGAFLDLQHAPDLVRREAQGRGGHDGFCPAGTKVGVRR